MAGPLPPLPPGFEVEKRPDPWTILRAEGFVATNGFRTDEDVQDIKRQGYKPAAKGAHNRGDGVDLTHPKLSPAEQSKRLKQLARQHGWKGARILDEGHHRHLELPGWGAAPGTPGTRNSGLPAVPKGFTLEQRGSLSGGNFVASGEVHDGDTLKLQGGRNARLAGADAWELQQQGRNRANALVPLGTNARDFLDARVGTGALLSPTGGQTYGRPLVNLDDGTTNALLRNGHALAMPQYLQGDPRLRPYMEAERLARQNRLGGHGTNAETPEQFRHKDGPWKGAEPGKWGEGQAVFGDEETPFMGLRPEIAAQYEALAKDPASTEADWLAFGKANGIEFDPDDVRRFISDRTKKLPGGRPAHFTPEGVNYQLLPEPLTDTGHGAAGAFGRGVADPINFVDEVGGIAQSLGLPSLNGPRENVWNSDRRFGDILWNNIDQNRSIIGYDAEHHPYARTGGQLASAVAAPSFGVARVGQRATARALDMGLSGFAAREAGQRAVTNRIAAVGAGEGAAAGAGAGEGGPIDRLPDTLTGAALGLAGGTALGVAGEAVSPLVARALDAFRRRTGRNPNAAELQQLAREATDETAPIVNDGVQNAGPTPAGVAAMRTGNDSPELVGPAERQRDYLDLGDLPPVPEGFVLEDSLGAARKMSERAGPEALADAARTVLPEDVVPLPVNRVQSIEEAAAANPGTVRQLEAPDELDELGVRRIPSRKDLFKWTSVRGPLDITQTLRTFGGVRDDGGDLRHLGIDGTARRMAFGSNEQFLGRLINNEDGLTLDEATERLWEQGYFPEFRERPTINDLLERLHAESTGAQRYFHPDTLDEVERFERAQAERFRIEQAEAEGSPLAERVGEPVTLDDLAANTAPATAYEELGTLGGKVANIDLSKLETKDDIARLLSATESRFGGFDAARRGKVSHAETEALASELNLTADDLLRRRQGQALNAEQALQARRILAKSGEEVVALAKKIKAGNNGDLDVSAFHLAMLRHAAIQEQVTGMTAEAGRALNQFRIVAKASKHREKILKSVIEGAGGKHSLEEAADMILDLQGVPGALNKFALDAVKPTWKDKLVELWYNSLLSGPQTHAVNILSNALTAGLQLPEHLAAAAIGTGRAAAAKVLRRKEVDRVLMSEVGPRVVGLLQGAREGLRAFRHTLRTGEVSDHVTKVESAKQEAIGGVTGKVVRVPTRLLASEDEFFKATARRMELAGLAVRKARSEGLKGEALQARIAELTANPTPEMVEKSLDYARYLTFQRPLGPAMQNVMSITQKHKWLKLFVPFIRTPTNILKFAAERSPAAPILKEVRDSIKAGGAARDMALARVTLGTGLGLLVAQWTADGTLTGGGPADENAKRLMREDGWEPYSIRIGDRYYSYRRLDPLATTIGTVADMIDLQGTMTERQRAEVVPLVVASIIQNLGNKTWLSGLSDVLAVIEDPQRNSHHFIERLAGSVAVPTLSAQIARTVDPVQRETSSEGYGAGIVDAIRARIPGASKGLQPRRGVFGEEVQNEGGLGPDLASPIWTGTAKNDPVVRETLDAGAVIGPLGRDVAGGRLPDDLFNQYQAIAGQLTKQFIQQEMAAPDWRQVSSQERKRRIEAARDDARREARGALLAM